MEGCFLANDVEFRDPLLLEQGVGLEFELLSTTVLDLRVHKKYLGDC